MLLASATWKVGFSNLDVVGGVGDGDVGGFTNLDVFGGVGDGAIGGFTNLDVFGDIGGGPVDVIMMTSLT